MIVRYRNYTIPEGRTEIRRTVTGNFNAFDDLLSTTVRTELDGRLKAASQSAMNTAARNLISAFGTDGGDLLVLLANGVTASELTMRSTGSLAGVKVVQRPSFPTLQNAAYTTWCPFTIILEAEYPASNAALLYREFEETIVFEGGGPEFGWFKPLVGFPSQQQLRQRDTYRATQSGHAIGYLARPVPPNPLWLSALSRFPTVTKRSPQRRGSSYVDFYTAWEYVFESSVPLVGNPNVR